MFRFWQVLVLTAFTLSPVKAEVLQFICSIDGIAASIQVDTEAKEVIQRASAGGLEITAEYKDGVFGKVSKTGLGASTRSTRQFVKISDSRVYFGGMLNGNEEGSALDRRTGVILVNGKAGRCALLPK
jgi:hypothetical protein